MFAVHCQALGKAGPSPGLLSASNRKSTKEPGHLQEDPGPRSESTGAGHGAARAPRASEPGDACVIKGAVLCKAGGPGPARQGRW